jgi:hypothetical protein
MAEPAQDMELLPPDAIPFEEQPELLDVTEYARALSVEQMVREHSCLPASPTETLKRCSNQRTGKILLKQLRNDMDLAEALCSALLLGMSARQVARRFRISPDSVVVVREAMTDRGELRAVRLRVQAKIDRLAEDGLDETHEGLMAGKIHPGQGWIPTLATVDKRAQAEAGMVSGTDRTVEEVTVARLMAARELVLASRASASEATADGAQPTGSQSSTAEQSAPATGPATGTRALPADGQAGAGGAVRLEVPAAAEGGGGVGVGRAGREGDGLASKILRSKEDSSTS